MDSNQYRVLEGNISVPYRWTPGDIYGRFLGGLKEKKILGFRCPECKKVYAPATDICVACYYGFKPEDQVELPDSGVVKSFTVVRANLWPPKPDPEVVSKAIAPTKLEDHPLLWPPAPPYALVAVRIEGADTDFIHMVKGEKNLGKLKVGSKVKAVWAEQREGYLLDLDHFEVI